MGLRTLVLALASALAFGGLVYLVAARGTPPEPAPFREPSPTELVAERSWHRAASENGERLLFHLSRGGRHFLSTEEGVREAGSWVLESEDGLVLQSDGGKQTYGTLEPYARAGARGCRSFSLSLDGIGWMTEVLDRPLCGWDTLID